MELMFCLLALVLAGKIYSLKNAPTTTLDLNDVFLNLPGMPTSNPNRSNEIKTTAKASSTVLAVSSEIPAKTASESASTPTVSATASAKTSERSSATPASAATFIKLATEAALAIASKRISTPPLDTCPETASATVTKPISETASATASETAPATNLSGTPNRSTIKSSKAKREKRSYFKVRHYDKIFMVLAILGGALITAGTVFMFVFFNNMLGLNTKDIPTGRFNVAGKHDSMYPVYRPIRRTVIVKTAKTQKHKLLATRKIKP